MQTARKEESAKETRYGRLLSKHGQDKAVRMLKPSKWEIVNSHGREAAENFRPVVTNLCVNNFNCPSLI